MKAIILAAGRGERLRPLTDHTPKPLLLVGGQPLIHYQLVALAKCGIEEVVINVSHLADKIQTAIGDGSHYGLKIAYSLEPEPLETGGGIIKALPKLGAAPFLAINADIWTDYPLQQLLKPLKGLAHLVLVDNPKHHPQGDYSLQNNTVGFENESKLTFSGMGVYHPQLFANHEPISIRLPTLLKPLITQQKVSGEHYQGHWFDVGTLERLQQVNERVPL